MTPPVFVNNSQETWTPTQSGALATVIWECCRVARGQGLEPLVITRSSPARPYDWDRTVFLDYPSVPNGALTNTFLRAERRLTGWPHFRQRAYAARVARAIKQAGAGNGTLILLNDPEMAVFLRRRFPKAFLIHWFQNQLECRSPFRLQFAQAANMVVAVSNYTARWIEDYYGLPESSVRTLYNAVDAEWFRPVEGPVPAVPVVNFVGRTGIEKAPDLLLSAAIALSAKNRAFSVQLIGSNHWGRWEDDPYQQHLSALVTELESRGVSVRRAGHVDRNALPGEIRKAHIHVVPSRWDEPFGLTTLEGMACGLAVIGSNTGGTPEVIGDAGLLFERESVEGLADRLGSLVGEAGLRAEYARLGRERAQGFTWERTWGQLRGLVEA